MSAISTNEAPVPPTPFTLFPQRSPQAILIARINTLLVEEQKIADCLESSQSRIPSEIQAIIASHTLPPSTPKDPHSLLQAALLSVAQELDQVSTSLINSAPTPQTVSPLEEGEPALPTEQKRERTLQHQLHSLLAQQPPSKPEMRHILETLCGESPPNEEVLTLASTIRSLQTTLYDCRKHIHTLEAHGEERGGNTEIEEETPTFPLATQLTTTPSQQHTFLKKAIHALHHITLATDFSVQRGKYIPELKHFSSKIATTVSVASGALELLSSQQKRRYAKYRAGQMATAFALKQVQTYATRKLLRPTTLLHPQKAAVLGATALASGGLAFFVNAIPTRFIISAVDRVSKSSEKK